MATPLFSFRLNPEIRGEVQKLADKLGISESEVVRRTVVQMVESLPLAQLTGGSRAEVETPREREVTAA